VPATAATQTEQRPLAPAPTTAPAQAAPTAAPASGPGTGTGADQGAPPDARRDERPVDTAPAAPVATATPPPAPAQAPAAASPAVPAAPAAPATAPAIATPVPPVHTGALADRIEHVALLAARGTARAQIVLKPAELGTVDVRLKQTSGGLVASISVHEASSLQAVQQAGAELRQSLEDRGITLQRLDIQLTGTPAQAGQQQQDRRDAAAHQRAGRSSDRTDTDLTEGDEPIEAVAATSTNPAGVLVDVQA
jgi:hypothetical protein